MPMSPEEAALLVKLQVMKAERDRYRAALDQVSHINAIKYSEAVSIALGALETYR